MYYVVVCIKLNGSVTLLPVYFYLEELCLHLWQHYLFFLSSSGCYIHVMLSWNLFAAYNYGQHNLLVSPSLSSEPEKSSNQSKNILWRRWCGIRSHIGLIYAPPSIIFVLHACLQTFQMFIIVHCLSEIWILMR